MRTVKRGGGTLANRILQIAAAGTLLLASSAQAETIIKLAHVNPADWRVSQKGAAGDVFKSMVESESGGRMKVELYPAGQLGAELELVGQVKSGALQMTMVSGVFGRFCKEVAILDTPYLFSSAPVAYNVLDSDFGRHLADHCLKQTGMRILAYGEVGFRNFTNNVREIKTPDDIKGLKLRVQEVPLYVTLVKAMGGVPTPIAWSETPGALKTGVVDGQENPVAIILSMKFYEFQKYITLDQHVYGTDFILINEAFFAGLSKEDREIVTRNAQIAGRVSQSIQQINSAAGIAELQKNGMKVYKPTSEQLAQFRAKAQPPVLDYLKTQVDPKWIDELNAAVARAEKDVTAQ